MATPGISDVYYWIAVVSMPDKAPSDFDLEAVKSIIHRVLAVEPDHHGLHLPRFMELAQAELGPSYQAPDVAESNAIEGLFLALRTADAITTTDPLAFKHGVYDHFKGGVYKSNKLGLFANDAQYVDYTSLTYGTDHARFLKEWSEVVQWPDGKYRSRFVYRGPDLRTPEPSYKVPR